MAWACADPPDDRRCWTMQLPAPADGATACVDRTVFGQLRNAASPDTPAEEISDALRVDPGVDAIVLMRNLYLHSNPDVFEAGELLENGIVGACNGDPRYTRVPIYFLEVRERAGECSGLTELMVGSTRVTVADNYSANVGALPNQNMAGENQWGWQSVGNDATLRSTAQPELYPAWLEYALHPTIMGQA